MTTLATNSTARHTRISRHPRHHQVRTRACTIPNGATGDNHLAIYHPASGTLTYSGPASGSGWNLTCRLARILGAKPRSIPMPTQVDILDRAMLYDETGDHTLYAALNQHELEMFWGHVLQLRQLAIQAVA